MRAWAQTWILSATYWVIWDDYTVDVLAAPTLQLSGPSGWEAQYYCSKGYHLSAYLSRWISKPCTVSWEQILSNDTTFTNGENQSRDDTEMHMITSRWHFATSNMAPPSVFMNQPQMYTDISIGCAATITGMFVFCWYLSRGVCCTHQEVVQKGSLPRVC